MRPSANGGATARKVELREVGLRYFGPEGETEALKRISLSIAPGEFVAIIGQSGCGKSTVLSLISGILEPTSGTVLIDGKPVMGPSRKVGYMQFPPVVTTRAPPVATRAPGPMRALDVRGRGRGFANMTVSPMNPTARLNAAPRCGAKTRAGTPCRCPAVKNRPRCRLHGCARGSGGQLGPKNGRYRTGKYSQAGKEVGAVFRKMAKAGEALAAVTLHRHGLRPPKPLRRRAHVKRALAKVQPKEQQK